MVLFTFVDQLHTNWSPGDRMVEMSLKVAGKVSDSFRTAGNRLNEVWKVSESKDMSLLCV